MLNNVSFKNSWLFQLVIALGGSLLLGWFTDHGLSADPKKLAAIIAVVIIAMLIFTMLKRYIYSNTATENLLYLLIISSFFGPAVAAINVGSFSLFPYRVLFLVMLPIFAWRFFTNRITPWSQITVKNILLFHIFWVSYAFLSLIWVKSTKEGIIDFIFLFIGVFLIFFVTFVFDKKEKYLKLFYVWIVFFVVLLGFGLMNHFLLIHFKVSRYYTYPSSNLLKATPTSVFANENDYASFISISFFFVLALFNRSKSIFVKAIAAVIMIVALYITVLTSSRANYIALLLGLTVWFFFLTKKSMKRFLIISFTTLIVLAVALFSHKVGTALTSINTVIDSLSGGGQSAGNSVEIRQNLIKNALHFVAESFGFGVGPGNSMFYLQYFRIYPTYSIINVHNWWFDIMVDYGIYVFTGYVLLYVGIIYKIYKIYRQSSDENRMIPEALLTSFIAFSLACISPSSQITLNYLWLLFAFAIGYINIWNKEQKTLSNASIKVEE